MLRRFVRSSLALTLALGATACGSSHRASFDSGLGEDRRIATLSAPEMTQLCQATSDYFERAQADVELRRSACIYQILASGIATTPETCETALSSCVDMTPPTSGFDCSMVSTLPECDATVGDFEVCASDQIDQYADAGAGLDCSLAGSPDLAAMLEGRMIAEVPASCAPIRDDVGCQSGGMGAMGAMPTTGG